MGTIPANALPKIKDFYYRQGLGAPQIAKRFRTSTDAVYYFMRHHRLKRRNLSEENSIRFQRKLPSFHVPPQLTATEQRLKAIGVMLYWAEGFQADTAKIVDFANSKPAMILIFLKFLRDVCGIDERRLRSYLYCYENQDPDRLIRFWSKTTKIPKRQFTKPYVRKDFDIRKSDKMKYGLLHIRYGDKKLLDLIRRWIGEYIRDTIGNNKVDATLK